MLEACEPPCEDGDTPRNISCFSESMLVHCGQNGNKGSWVGQASSVAALLATEAQQEAKALVRKLQEKLRLEKDMWLPTARLASRLADRVRE